MKITFITSFFYPIEGGMEKHVQYLAEELIKKGHKVEVITSNLSREGRINKPEEIYKKINIRRVKVLFKIGDFASFFPGVFNIVRKSKSDIIHIHAYRNPHNAACLFTKKPTVLTPHWPNYPGQRKKWLEIAAKIFDKTIGKIILKRFNRILAVTKPEIEWLEKELNVPNKKIRLLPNGIPKEQLKKRDENRFRQKHRINKNEIIAMYFGRLHKSKGVDLVVRSAQYFPKVKFVIMGNGPELNNLKKLAKNTKNIKFIYGKITDEEKMEAYSAADIFIHPSHYDAFGITVLEAFSQGCAVITSDQGGLPWVVDNAGLIFKDNNLEDLKDKISELIQNKKLRLELQKEGRERVKEFTWDKIAKDLEKIYKELLD